MSKKSFEQDKAMLGKAEQIARKAVAEARAENAEERSKQKKRAIKLGLMTVLTALIMILASAAWFASNNTVVADTMAIQANGTSFDIATNEEKISYEQKLNEADSSYKKGDAVTLKNEDGENGTYYISSTGSLILQCKANPEDKTGQSGDKNIGPGDGDKLNLYAVARNDASFSAEVQIRVIGYTALDVPKTDDRGEPMLDDETGEQVMETKLFKTSELSTTNSPITSEEEINKYKQAEKYLQGHIMFFGGQGDTDEQTEEANRYYFTEPLEYSRTQNCWKKQYDSPSTVTANTAYDIPIYWMWPNTLGQIALKDNTSKQRKGYPMVSDTNTADKSKVIAYLKTNKVNIFTNSSKIADDTDESTHDGDIENAAENFHKLSDGYNGADFDIGNYIDYFMIEVDVVKK